MSRHFRSPAAQRQEVAVRGGDREVVHREGRGLGLGEVPASVFAKSASSGVGRSISGHVEQNPESLNRSADLGVDSSRTLLK